MHTGSCLCGAVSFNVSTELQPPDACHCTTCRKWSGHFFVSTDIVTGALDLSGADKVTWYQSSQKVRREFCSVCGSTLFFDPLFHDWTAIAMGAFDAPTGTALGRHIFVSEKADYYKIKDGLPQNQT
jgi:hypothetical protein